MSASDAERTRLRKIVDASGISLSCLATSCVFADPEKREAMITDTITRIHLAADVGAPCVRVFGSTFPDTMSYREHLPREIAMLRRYELDIG